MLPWTLRVLQRQAVRGEKTGLSDRLLSEGMKESRLTGCQIHRGGTHSGSLTFVCTPLAGSSTWNKSWQREGASKWRPTGRPTRISKRPRKGPYTPSLSTCRSRRKRPTRARLPGPQASRRSNCLSSECTGTAHCALYTVHCIQHTIHPGIRAYCVPSFLVPVHYLGLPSSPVPRSLTPVHNQQCHSFPWASSIKLGCVCVAGTN